MTLIQLRVTAACLKLLAQTEEVAAYRNVGTTAVIAASPATLHLRSPARNEVAIGPPASHGREIRFSDASPTAATRHVPTPH